MGHLQKLKKTSDAQVSYLGYAICLRLPTVLLGWLWNVDWYSILEHHGIKFID